LSGPPESGKTRALNTCIKVARRGILTMNAREAALIRYAQDLKATIALDVVDLMAYVRPMQDFFAARTKNDGALTTRILDFAKGPFNGLQHYAPFGATLVASNTGLSEDWIVSRTLVISACRATRSFVAPPDAAKANDLRERGTAFRGRVLMALAAGKKLPSQPRIADGRLGDLLSGLVQAIMLTAPARLPELQSLVPSFTAGRKADVLESIEVEVLRVCIEQMGGRGEPQIDVRLVDLVREINWQRADAGDRALSSRKVAPLLRTTLGLETWAGAGNYTRVTLPAKRLSQLAARYGLGGIGEHVKVATARAIGRIAPAPAPRTVTVKKLRS
jgi:hypothetical protein